MLVYLLSGLLCLLSGLCDATPHLLYVFPVVLSVTFGAWAKVIILLYFVILVYGMIELLVVKLSWYAYSALSSPLYFVSNLLETINNNTFYLFSLESQPMEEPSFHIFPFSFRPITIAFENSENSDYPWDAETGMALLLGTISVVQVLFRVKQLFVLFQLWQWAMQLNQRTNLCWHQSPLYTRRNGQGSQLIQWRRMKQGHHNYRRRGRNHLITILDWAVQYAKRFQLPSRWAHYHLAAPMLG